MNVKKTIAMLIASTLMLTFTIIPSAAASPEETYDEIPISTESIDILSNYLIRNEDGTLELSEEANSSDINLEFLSEVNKNLEFINSLVLNNEAITDEQGNIEFTEKITEGTNAIIDGNSIILINDGISSRQYRGVDRLDTYWWGTELFLSYYTCQGITGVGGAAAAIMAKFPEPLVSKALAIVTLAGIGLIQWNNRYGTGVMIRQFLTHPIWIESQ